MINKLTFVAGFSAGYVLGAKAGTSRYQQIKAKASELSGKPAVQHLTSTVQAKASDLAGKAVGSVNTTVASVTGKRNNPTPTTPVAPVVVDLNGNAPQTGVASHSPSQ